jgi:calcineurin-like phosphoesterase family protein
MSATWFTADTHFGHKRIVELSDRPFATLAEMHDYLIDTWNSLIGRKDRVFVVGDFGFAGPLCDLDVVFGALRGEKHLVVGNHDEDNPKVLRLPWVSQTQIAKVKDDGRRVVACHYPMTTWPGVQRGYPHVHGHSHGTLRDVRPMRADVGVDVPWPLRGWGEPLEYGVVHATLSAQAYAAVDHHAGVS